MKTINQKQRLNTEWRKLIKENLQKGTPFQTIVTYMLQNGFDPSYAMTAVQIFKDELMSEYKYETPIFSYEGDYIQTTDRYIPIRARMNKPFIVVLDDVLSFNECDQLIEISKGRLRRSETVDRLTGERIIEQARTSHGTTFKRGKNEFISRLELRFSEIMNWPTDRAEQLQVINYKPGEEYKPHFDYFSSENEGDYSYLDKKGGQRVSTLIVYLNEVEEGGSTIFPSIGLSILPKKGSAVYFEYYNSFGQVDPLTLHAGSPVIKGEKWIVTQWMRQKKSNTAVYRI